jgi:hypothetical protein
MNGLETRRLPTRSWTGYNACLENPELCELYELRGKLRPHSWGPTPALGEISSIDTAAELEP